MKKSNNKTTIELILTSACVVLCLAKCPVPFLLPYSRHLAKSPGNSAPHPKEERRIKLQSSPNIWLSHNFCHFWPPSPNFLFPSPSLNSLQLAANASTLPRHLSEKFSLVLTRLAQQSQRLRIVCLTSPTRLQQQWKSSLPRPLLPASLDLCIYTSL